MSITVERRDADDVVLHGSLAGLTAGLVLGATTMVGSLILAGSAWLPFRFVAAFVVGPDALRPEFPLGPALLLGGAVHFGLSALFGVLFVGLLALTYQLSARAWLLLVYGGLFGFAVWEVDFLAVVPTFFPYLVRQLDLATQVWNGALSYLLVYGPVLGAYVAFVRPGVVGDWRAAGAPAGKFAPPAPEERD